MSSAPDFNNDLRILSQLKYVLLNRNGPMNETFFCNFRIAENNEGSCWHAQMRRLARAFAAPLHNFGFR